MTLQDRAALERSERITMLTDFFLALVAVGLGVPLLGRFLDGGGPAIFWWAIAFLFTAAAAIVGGLFHGTRLYVAGRTADRLWRATVLLTPPVGVALLLAGAFTVPTGSLRSAVVIVALLKAVGALWLLSRSFSFAVATIDAGISLVLLALLVVLALMMGEVGREGLWTLAGVGVAVVGAAIQQRGVGAGRPLDHNDLFHIAQALACWLFFQGAIAG